LRGDCTGLRGWCTYLEGDCTGIFGDCTGINGDFDDCEITLEERKKGVDIRELVK